MTDSQIAALTACLSDPARLITNAQTVQRLSRDFYWYSPILKKQLEDKTADVAIQPTSVEEIRSILTYCHQQEIPVTARGAGTGNYGQAIPLERGVVLDLIKMDAIEAITPDGVAICQPGVRLGVLEAAAREQGFELRCYPSTVVKASVGGFLGGGSGGIGSIAHGGLRDFQTVRAIEVVTMEATPRVVLHEGTAVHDVMHSWGTNGIITRIWLALTPAVEWAQCVVAFPTFDEAFTFSEQIAVSEAWIKRLITTFEWPIPSCFTPIAQVTREGKSLIFFMIAAAQLEALQAAAIEAGGEITLAAPYTGLRTLPLLSDYTWNHTTLWAIKQDDTFTYLQCGFNPGTVRDQFAQLKAKFGDEILFHIEWMKNGTGTIIPGSIPLVRYTTEGRLNEMIDFCRSIGVGVANPHVNNVEGGGRYREDNVQLQTKYKYDPKGLLNPGKMTTFIAKEVIPI
ncbi:FAD-binding oxidoreductase [Granulicella aggregans]|uniref:FAD-binding oxidoreductase n=1 Tax=Granulicella aggregans TaxID=474949 RepID=UPI0021DF5B0D|nr:FAD-binding oxidoreductase [Granulicella aggregans]